MAGNAAGRRPRGDALIHGLPGHPLHPPLTDATIGMFVLATVLAIVGAAGAIEDAAGKGCWLALVGGLAVAAVGTATGFADWVRLEWGSPPWRTATLHLTAMLCAVVLFALAAWLQYDGYRDGEIETGGLIFSVAGFVALTTGGWLGGAIVFVHGIRVLARDGPPEATGDADARARTTSSRR